jgi:hypothetical protein
MNQDERNEDDGLSIALNAVKKTWENPKFSRLCMAETENGGDLKADAGDFTSS